VSALPEAVVLFGASGFIGRNILARLVGTIPAVYGVTHSGVEVPGCAIVVAANAVRDLPPLPADTIAINAAAYRYNAATFRAEQTAIFDANVRIANVVLGFAAERNISEIRLASSSAVYPAEWTLLDDERPIDLNAPPHSDEALYAWSKRWAEIASDLHHQSSGINTLTFRLTNPYGPFDSTDPAAAHVVAAFVMRALLSSDLFEIRGNPNAERDFIFAGDVAETFLASLSHRGLHDAFNLGFGETISVRDLATVAVRVGGKSQPIVVVGEMTEGALVRRATVTKLRRSFDLPPFRSLDRGLAVTFDWYRDALQR